MPFHSEAESYLPTGFVNIAIMSVLQIWDNNGQTFRGVSQYLGEAGTKNARRFFASTETHSDCFR